MAYNKELAEKVRNLLRNTDGLTEKQMFGGLAFMLNGNMACGVVGEELMVRVGPENYQDALAERYTRPMDYTGRPLKGMVYVEEDAVAADLDAWVSRGAEFAGSLPPK
ncbi:TfoX/Sxy family protein [Microbulbifer thermotolerans]|uniref:RNA methyltransferase n=1 Tax=Microbulbifer thermotolerans TaxID=252514 RepID=A0A143HQR8_MICTH|nr:TfoX/Sxy family protein [Microbulbifer thermotolerans]AMX04075.1 RNA methyltransferase [Microbulbifer thermotolerans]MCX2778943.1 TfoX/Sxy family protein [Microbulbifer thermotolerans]MCX2781425.1 TfoX/Sxy family protein [Microbulbifer thermotolerans]MCX2793828.1 TfoX/Sxy family protein [Microbulbifer thermotolerans]MCX2802389.1 TfoX/Sxy family protein [Microbulbifer thermotolerans]